MKSRFFLPSCVVCAFFFIALPLLISCDNINAPEDSSLSGGLSEPEWWNDSSDASASTGALAATDGYWTKAIGTPDGREELKRMVRTSDGGYVVFAEPFTTVDWLFKIDKNGALVWQKNISAVRYGYINSIEESPDGGLYVSGSYHNSETDSSDYADFLAKLDEAGNTVWSKSFNVVKGMTFSPPMAVFNDGSVVIAAHVEAENSEYWDSDIAIMKVSPAGGFLWVKKLAGSGAVDDSVVDMAVTADGNIVLVGSTDRVYIEGKSQDEAAMIAKISPDGDLLWNRVYAYTGDLKLPKARLNTVQPTSDGGFIATGAISYIKGISAFEDRDPIDRSDVLVLKCDSSGNITWRKRFRNMLSISCVSSNMLLVVVAKGYQDDLDAAIQTADGGYMLQGHSSGHNILQTLYYDYIKTDRVGWLMKLTSTGKVSWIRGYRDAFRESTSDEYSPNGYRKYNSLVLGSLREADNGDMVAGGTIAQGNSRDVFLMKTDSKGAISSSEIKVYNNLTPTYVDACIAPADDDMVISDYTAGAVIDVILNTADTDCTVTDL
ncbi:MAG TPA: hypothetical protein PK573_02015 [Spirochaetota bacterium]|nr:hypothetical protein [Spirochaetota bacterium]HRZ26877.1 hypothetical protein [Spirochaetota bacterium]HSA13947.1 hypothetical protein [Spirochaetota bacterium]